MGTNDVKRRGLAARWAMIVLCGLVLGALLAACGGGGSSSSSSSTTASEEESSAGGESTGGEENSEEASGGGEAFVTSAEEFVADHTAPQTEWTGPTKSSKPPSGASVAITSCGQAIEACGNPTKYIEEIVKPFGWKSTVLDGALTVSGWTTAMNQAIALNPSGIFDVAIDPQNVPQQVARANSSEIPVVGTLTSAHPGPSPEGGLFYDSGMNWAEAGEAAAKYVIAESEGKARVIVVTDNTFSVARTKLEGIENALGECTTCEVLETVNTPAGEIAKNGPGLMSGWISKYGSEPFYVLSVSDDFLSAMLPALTAHNESKEDVKLVGMDGTKEAFERIRSGNYQVATVPQSVHEIAYGAVNAMIAALNGEEPFDYKPALIIFDKENIETEGGKEDTFIPSNGFEEKFKALWGE
jgi:ribose transport system substrate-binding protein